MKNVIRKTFEIKYPHLVEPNIRTFERGYETVQFKTFEMEAGAKGHDFSRPMPFLGYETQSLGGVLTAQANSIQKDLSGSRQGFLPKFVQEECINCAACDTACPDFCFVWKEGEDKRGRKQMFLQGIDYQYCKGCLKCVEACPTSALSELREAIGYADANETKQSYSYVAGGIS
jgi:pyruvate ferredoxin oxidoreductase gamma subunit